MSYDAAGRRTGLFDPNSGQESVQYDALGQALRTASDGSRTERKYDLLGRVLEQTDRLAARPAFRAGSTTRERKAWASWSAVAGLSPGAALRRSRAVEGERLGYRSRRCHPQLPGVVWLRRFQPPGEHHPGQRPGAAPSLQWTAAAGEQDGAGTTLRQIQARDARDQIVRESYGNGVLSQRDYQPATGWLTRIQASKGGSVPQSLSYRYDGLGNLLERSDARGYSEVLSYDDLNRLLRSARTLDGTQVVQDFTYDALGNLTGKSGVGAYRYGSYSSAEQQLCAGRGGWPSPDRTPCAAPAPGRIAMTLAATSPAGRGDKSSTHRSINPWKFPQVPASAASPTIPSASATCRRWMGAPPSTWTRGVSRRSTTAAQLAGRLRRRLPDPAQGRGRRQSSTCCAMRSARWKSCSTPTVPSANASLSPRSANTVALTGRTTATNPPPPPPGVASPATSTWRSPLVHMNGRVYDPVIGRFLSADIVYQDTANAQAYNRYSYGWNNPIASVDPTGYALEEISSGNSWYSPFISNSWLVLGNAFKGNLPDSYWDLGVGRSSRILTLRRLPLLEIHFLFMGFRG